MISSYALVQDRIVSILDVCDKEISDKSDFICPRCRTPMLPAVGKVIRPHFRHRDLSKAKGRGCSPEGILHHTAKLVIAERVALNAASGSLYLIKLAEAIACPMRSKILRGECLHRKRKRTLNLSGMGPAIVEAHDSPFRYDLLFSPGGQAKLAIEIVVSSPVTVGKKKSKVPLIEIFIQSDEDIEKLKLGINDSDLTISYHHMTPHLGAPATTCADTDCASRCMSFSVSHAGRIQLEVLHPFEATRPRSGRAFQSVHASTQALSLPKFEALDRLARSAYFKDGAPVRSCLVCRHHNIVDYAIQGDGPILCLQDGKTGSVNRGAGCLYFTPFASLNEARRHRLRNVSSGVIEE